MDEEFIVNLLPELALVSGNGVVLQGAAVADRNAIRSPQLHT
jgi:hypothetical protein